MTVRELLARISSRELSEWMAYEELTGPLGGARGDFQAGVVAATVANSVRSKGRPLTPADFVPKWDRSPRSPGDLWRQAMAANSALGGSISRKG